MESLRDIKVAYLLTAEPEPFNVKVRRGVPLTVTDSEKLTVKLSAPEGLYVPLAGGETDEMVGALRSMTMVVVAGEADDGPVVVPETELAFNRGIKVPSPQFETINE